MNLNPNAFLKNPMIFKFMEQRWLGTHPHNILSFRRQRWLQAGHHMYLDIYRTHDVQIASDRQDIGYLLTYWTILYYIPSVLRVFGGGQECLARLERLQGWGSLMNQFYAQPHCE